MFTGLVQAKGTVLAAENGRFTIASPWDAASIPLGASICCDGCCLSVTGVESIPSGTQFKVDVSNETLSKTTLDDWCEGRRINLERSLRAGDELGGHLVSGHVDGVARIVSIKASGFSKIFEVRTPHVLAKYIAPKGSVALDGVSLTVNTVDDTAFSVLIIPHTLDVTTLGGWRQGSEVNIEVDLMARYAARLAEMK